ncbi:MAG TPA: hypothetical protein VGD43_05750 [Micromonospora sp.]
MSEPLKVHLDAMTRYATELADLSRGFADTRALLVDADVTTDSFGLLPESRDAADVYEQRTTAGLEVLRSGEDIFADLAEGFRQMRDNYSGTDQAAARRFGG